MQRIVFLSVLAGITLSVLQLLLGSADAEPMPSQPHPVAEEIKTLLVTQAERWSAGDIDGFMEYYWKSEELTFCSGGTTRRGWQATIDSYKKRYPTPERMGRTTFSKLEVRPLGDSAALVLGRWNLQREPDPLGGNFTLVLEKIAGKWLIIHDHTSQLAE